MKLIINLWVTTTISSSKIAFTTGLKKSLGLLLDIINAINLNHFCLLHTDP